tara:strand:- start:72 stop:1067 length:996 start_codon:yes stop_codon:yes gene_type:complete
MATVIWNGSVDGDYSNASNWTGGLPGASDDVVFDGRTTTGPSTNLDEADDLGSVHIMSSCTYDIGTSSVYWEFQCAGTVNVEGTGTYHLRCGNGSAADTDILTLIINTTGTVNLASEKNANGGNESLFGTIEINNGTVNLKGNADSVGNEAGVAYSIIRISPASGASPTINIGDQCRRHKFGTANSGSIYQSGGTVNLHSQIVTYELYGGTCNVGSTAYSMDGGATNEDDDITTLNIYGGTFNWQPSVVSASVRTTASDSPTINVARIMAGTFNASSMLETLTTAPTISNLNLYGPGSFNIANGYGNIAVTNFNHYGGTITASAGQDLTLT